MEILLVFRLRELIGLSNPAIEHPLLEGPFDALPPAQPLLGDDALMLAALARAQSDWPDFQEVVSLSIFKHGSLM
jgi:hypothetical protein